MNETHKISKELADRFEELGAEQISLEAQTKALYEVMAGHRKGFAFAQCQLWKDVAAETGINLSGEAWVYDVNTQEIRRKPMEGDEVKAVVAAALAGLALARSMTPEGAAAKLVSVSENLAALL